MSELTPLDPPPSPSGDLASYPCGLVLVDRYMLVRAVGRGGTAVVWVARDSVLDIDVAVKIVLPCSQDFTGELKQRTIQEARLCAQLTDPAVCRVLDFGFTHRGDPFVVSELLQGETLDDRMTREGRIGEVDAVRLLLPILDALGAAHRKGIVHRDVKPANVFLATSDGRTQPKLLDFGIACSLNVSGRTTTSGTICGTPCYMSPEQARGLGDIDARSDLWSFCMVLYEMVSGVAPFLGENYHSTLFAIANETAPPLSSFGCDARLARIVELGLAKEREARWPSAPELANALARWLVDRGFESDAYGLSLQRRFLHVPAAPEVRDEVSSARGVSFSLEQRQKPPRATRNFTAGTVLFALGTAAALAGVGWLQQSSESASAEPAPASLAPRPAPAAPPPAPPSVLPAPVLVDAPRVRPASALDVAGVRRDSPSARPKTPPPPSAVAPRPPPPAPMTSRLEALSPEPPPKPSQKSRPAPANALQYDFGI